jgi:hypothetical protein
MKTGAEQFREWIGRRFPGERPQMDAAKYFGWDETYISKLASGRQLPGLPNAIRIERLTGIPVEAWVATELAKLEQPESDDAAEVSVAQGGKRNVPRFT